MPRASALIVLPARFMPAADDPAVLYQTTLAVPVVPPRAVKTMVPGNALTWGIGRADLAASAPFRPPMIPSARMDVEQPH